MYICIEGVDGVGKSTQAQMLSNYFVDKYGIKPLMVREPGGTEFAEKLRNSMLDSDNAVDPMSMLLTMYAARADLLRTKVFPALRNGEIVISDRCSLSSWAYQFHTDKVCKYEEIEALEKMIYRGNEDLKPFIILLTAPTVILKNRLLKRGKDNNMDSLDSNIINKRKFGMGEYVTKCSKAYNLINIESMSMENVSELISSICERELISYDLRRDLINS